MNSFASVRTSPRGGPELFQAASSASPKRPSKPALSPSLASTMGAGPRQGYNYTTWVRQVQRERKAAVGGTPPRTSRKEPSETPILTPFPGAGSAKKVNRMGEARDETYGGHALFVPFVGRPITHPLIRMPITQAWDTAPASTRASNGRPATAPRQMSSNLRSRRFSRLRISLG